MSFKVKDYYYEKAKKDKFYARSIYKLEEIDKKFKVISKGNSVLDLGYFPGSWIQYTSPKVGDEGRVVGVDIKEVNKKLLNIKNIKLFCMDAFAIQDISDLEVSNKFDVLLSDMAPNTTGIRSVDQDRSLNLVETVFYLLPTFLKEKGNLVIKVFDGQKAQQYLKEQRGLFDKLEFLKPKSTRSVSKEFFVIGKGYRGS